MSGCVGVGVGGVGKHPPRVPKWEHALEWVLRWRWDGLSVGGGGVGVGGGIELDVCVAVSCSVVEFAFESFKALLPVGDGRGVVYGWRIYGCVWSDLSDG